MRTRRRPTLIHDRLGTSLPMGLILEIMESRNRSMSAPIGTSLKLPILLDSKSSIRRWRVRNRRIKGLS